MLIPGFSMYWKNMRWFNLDNFSWHPKNSLTAQINGSIIRLRMYNG